MRCGQRGPGMYHSGEHKVLGPGNWFGEHEEGSLAPQYFFAPKTLLTPSSHYKRGYQHMPIP